MIWHDITLFLIAVLGGALGGLIVHIVWSLIQDWKLQKWIDKESKWRKEIQDIKWKQLTDEDIMSLIKNYIETTKLIEK